MVEINVRYTRSIFLIGFILISKLSLGQFTKDRYHLKDSITLYKVQSYQIYEYSELNKDSTLLEVLSFDRKGNLIMEKDIGINNTITYQYDSLDRMIKSTENCPGIIYENEFYFYDSSNLIKKIRKDSSGFINETVDFIYENGRLTKEIIHSNFKSRNVSREFQVNYSYDSTGLRVTELRPDSTFKIEIEYNRYGGIIFYKMTSLKNQVPDPVWFSYVENLRIEEYRFFNGNKIVAEKMIYDTHGLIQEIQKCGDHYFSSPCAVITKFYYTFYQE